MLSARLPIPERQLASAVIQRALDDAATPDERLARPRVIPTPQGPRSSFTPGLKPREREEAVRFLVDQTQPWCGAREAWCELADLCPQRLRRSALTRIAPSAIPRDLRRALGMADPEPIAVVGDRPDQRPVASHQEAA
jgi:hypothetical protein